MTVLAIILIAIMGISLLVIAYVLGQIDARTALGCRKQIEYEQDKAIMFSISEVENIIESVVENINATELVRMSGLEISFVHDEREAGGVVFVKQGHLRCAVPVMLTQNLKGGAEQ